MRHSADANAIMHAATNLVRIDMFAVYSICKKLHGGLQPIHSDAKRTLENRAQASHLLPKCNYLILERVAGWEHVDGNIVSIGNVFGHLW